jgi:rare lipoprotein A
VKYQGYVTDLPTRRAASALARLAAVALALSLTALNACHRQPDRPVAPARQPAPVQTGVASYYARHFAGKATASGEPHRPNALTAASRTLPLGTTAKVTNRENGRTVTVKVNDRGPYAKNRILDVSPKAAKRLGFKHDGVAHVAVQAVQEPPPAR